MSTHTAVVNDEQRLTPEQALLTDQIGNEVYASHYSERKAYRFIPCLWHSLALRFDVAQPFTCPAPARKPLYSHRRDGPRSGNPVQRLELQSPARERFVPTSRIGRTTAIRSAAILSPRNTRSTTTSCPAILLRS